MSHYHAPTDDIGFLLREVFEFDGLMQTLPGHENVDADFAVTVIEEAAKFCSSVLVPLNRAGDEEGSSFADGAVSTPKGVADAYKAFVGAGWSALSGDTAFGGQGLPMVLQTLLDEIVSSTNLSFSLYPGLTRGAAEAIAGHATPELQATYLPKMISGEWTGAMALTEPTAGTDLGLLTTRANPVGDGTYRINGAKIFISSGDQDFGGNIIHLVLARLPDAPKGPRGISLFLTPKFLVEPDGTLGDRNQFGPSALEHKMGIRAQPTCAMNYDDALGWLVGEPGGGLNAMFTMMNSERFFVAVQGLGIAEAAHQKAVAYARERRQGRPLSGEDGPVAIIEHPDVRKMLLGGRSFADAARALAVWMSMQMDIAARHLDETKRSQARAMIALFTPVAKAAFTDFGFETAVASQMVFGGHGYIREWGMEQFVRDVRITQIYEGTNGVQAMDLVTRKLHQDHGATARHFFALVRADLCSPATQGAVLIESATASALDRLERTTEHLLTERADLNFAGSAATDYLRLFALVAFGWMWCRMAAAASGDNPLHRRKRANAAFFAEHILPQTLGLEAMIASGPASTMNLEANDF